MPRPRRNRDLYVYMFRCLYGKNGYSAIVSVLLVTGVGAIIASTFGAIVVRKQKILRNVISSAQSYYTAEAGVEDAILRVIDPALPYQLTETITLASTTASTTIVQTGNDITILSEGNNNNYIRNVQVSLSAEVDGASFNYGVQVGAGGILMKNKSTIVGNIYSNGNIVGVNTASSTGDVWVAGQTGLIDNFTVGGDAHAHTINESDILSDAYYQAISGGSVGGVSYPGSADPEPVAMPIADAQINSWKQDAADGGEMIGNYIYEAGNTSLGLKKITGNLTLGGTGNDVFTLTGIIWVTGDLILENSGVIQLDSGYGENSGMIIVDGDIDLKNNFIICGSEGYNGSDACNAPNDSYVMLLTTDNSLDTGDPAIEMQNNARLQGILYAPYGLLFIKNDATLKEATAYQIQIENNAILIYESGLVNLNFSSGPGGGWTIGDWREVD